MFFKTILFLGQFVKEINSQSIWKYYMEKALIFAMIVGKYSRFKPNYVTLFDLALY
jgi:hypothetical protein